MLYFVMYDIEDNKIRNHIAKFLIKKGCMRVQKSIYLAKSSSAIYQNIADTLMEINAMYKNNDSIFLLPVPEDKLRVSPGEYLTFQLVVGDEAYGDVHAAVFLYGTMLAWV